MCKRLCAHAGSAMADRSGEQFSGLSVEVGVGGIYDHETGAWVEGARRPVVVVGASAVCGGERDNGHAGREQAAVIDDDAAGDQSGPEYHEQQCGEVPSAPGRPHGLGDRQRHEFSLSARSVPDDPCSSGNSEQPSSPAPTHRGTSHGAVGTHTRQHAPVGEATGVLVCEAEYGSSHRRPRTPH